MKKWLKNLEAALINHSVWTRGEMTALLFQRATSSSVCSPSRESDRGHHSRRMSAQFEEIHSRRSWNSCVCDNGRDGRTSRKTGCVPRNTNMVTPTPLPDPKHVFTCLLSLLLFRSSNKILLSWRSDSSPSKISWSSAHWKAQSASCRLCCCKCQIVPGVTHMIIISKCECCLFRLLIIYELSIHRHPADILNKNNLQ